MAEDNFDEEMRQLQINYLEETIVNLRNINSGLTACLEDLSAFNIDETYRSVHSLKGTAGTYGFMVFTDPVMHLEDVLSRVREKKMEMSAAVLRFIVSSFEILIGGFAEARELFIAGNIIIDKDSEFINSYFSLVVNCEQIVSACPVPERYLKARDGNAINDAENERAENIPDK